ncbi:hypothetical protein [Candidatus Uabimicrobium sp. HlEnr_7]|uniref:hypothetical protein n=1 Tax=Candidatus Uabimicrobium helgolandensis TaxID=3095367 RepID=UPI0035583975
MKFTGTNIKKFTKIMIFFVAFLGTLYLFTQTGFYYCSQCSAIIEKKCVRVLGHTIFSMDISIKHTNLSKFVNNSFSKHKHSWAVYFFEPKSFQDIIIHKHYALEKNEAMARYVRNFSIFFGEEHTKILLSVILKRKNNNESLIMFFPSEKRQVKLWCKNAVTLFFIVKKNKKNIDPNVLFLVNLYKKISSSE